jgi:hypothetical protein
MVAGGASMRVGDNVNAIRIVAILVAVGIMFPFERWLVAPWYVAVLLGILGYLLARHVGWAIVERRRLRRETDEVVINSGRCEHQKNSS